MLDVTVLLLNDNYPSTAIGPIEVFHSAGRLWNLLKGEPAEPRFRVTVASLDGKAVTSPYSVQLLPQASIDDINRHRALVGPGPGRPVRAPRCAASLAEEDGRPEMPDCRLLHGRCLSCGGRPLDGREATTHWATADEFRRRYPKVNWRPENFITEDRRMLCSGGVYSSMDLSLYLVEKFCGHEVALQCAKALLINMPRPCQSGYAVLPLSRPHDDDKVRAAEAYLEQNYARDVSVEALARSLNMSPRNFIRRFKTATGRLPGNYLQAMRVAKEMLEDGARSVQAVSTAVGYESPFFRGVFKRCTGMTPGEYRENRHQQPACRRQAATRGRRTGLARNCPRCATGLAPWRVSCPWPGARNR